MTDSINIHNIADAIYFSEISHDMFCDHRLPNHGMMFVRSGILRIETEEEIIEARAGDYIFWHRNCAAKMKKMIDLLEFMERHFTEDMTMEEFASYTGRSLATFKRDFAKFSPLTPQKWLIEQRLELSSRLLRETNVKPSAVYMEVGFKNRTHFSELFKQRYGTTPSAYQREGR